MTAVSRNGEKCEKFPRSRANPFPPLPRESLRVELLK